MADPIAGVKYRIQSVDFQTYLELVDSTINTSGVDNVRIRPVKPTDRQYWTFESVPGYNFYYVRNVANPNQCLYFNTGGVVYSGQPSTTYTLVNVAYTDGAYRLAFNYSSTNYYWVPQSSNSTVVGCGSGLLNIDSQKWQLVPVTSLPINNYPLEAGVYRIRNINGQSLLTGGKDAKDVYVRSQLGQSPYQRWTVTRVQPLGKYIIQNAGNHSYLGSGDTSIPLGNKLVQGAPTAFLWDLQSIGGFGWSLRSPKDNLSIGFADFDVNDQDQVTFVPSDITSSQLWFIEKYIPVGQDEIHAEREIPEGKYLLQSCHDQTIYMTASSAPYRITSGTAATSQFQLKYLDGNSARFTLTYDTPAAVPVVYDAGGYVGLGLKGIPFVLLEKDEGQPGYVICRPDVGRPRKVISARLTTDLNKNAVFAIEDETGEALQQWKFIPVTK